MQRAAIWKSPLMLASIIVLSTALTAGCTNYGNFDYDRKQMMTKRTTQTNQAGDVLHSPAPRSVDRDDLMGRNQNPNLIIGHSNVRNSHVDMNNMEMMAKSVPGVENARITLNGGNAYVTLDLKHNVTAKEAREIEKKVIAALHRKIPRYDFHVTSNEGFHR
ncbi:sporulation protein [Brevibacillus invocatus]|uniref:Sporulation protein n=1 Tax=Brevibacillus invocatus TaxID=173959 RepID=A0A3M8CLN5_9BACL|nr:YhcN/YlaJ family sporulation lipoprotein [Brevibacillus invocatus]RNB75785.1 sporulation protein [Brevibacillus invocatus]